MTGLKNKGAPRPVRKGDRKTTGRKETSPMGGGTLKEKSGTGTDWKHRSPRGRSTMGAPRRRPGCRRQSRTLSASRRNGSRSSLRRSGGHRHLQGGERANLRSTGTWYARCRKPRRTQTSHSNDPPNPGWGRRFPRPASKGLRRAPSRAIIRLRYGARPYRALNRRSIPFAFGWVMNLQARRYLVRETWIGLEGWYPAVDPREARNPQ